MTERCSSDQKYKTAAIHTVVANTCSNRAAVQKRNTFLIILYVILGMLGLVFILSIWCYRHQLNINRIAPFTPPSFCPNFIYPRPGIANNNMQEFDISYERFDNERTQRSVGGHSATRSASNRPSYPFGNPNSSVQQVEFREIEEVKSAK